MPSHSFNTDIADIYGITEALLIQYIDFILNHNKANNRNFHKGRFWMIGSVAGLHQVYQYLTPRQLHGTLENLRGRSGKARKRPDLYPVLLETNTLNRRTDDKTLWYTFTDPFIDRFQTYLAFCKQTQTEFDEVKAFYKEVCRNSGERQPTEESLLQICKSLKAYRETYPALKHESLLQICKSRFTNLEEGIYKFVKHIMNVNRDCIKEVVKERENKKPPSPLSPQEVIRAKRFKKRLREDLRSELNKITDLELLDRACEHLFKNGNTAGNLGTLEQVMRQLEADDRKLKSFEKAVFKGNGHQSVEEAFEVLGRGFQRRTLGGETE